MTRTNKFIIVNFTKRAYQYLPKKSELSSKKIVMVTIAIRERHLLMIQKRK